MLGENEKRGDTINLLLSIHNRYVKEIIAGHKGYEFRKGGFDQNKVSNIYVYETAPVKKITGRLTIDGIIEGPPEEVWSQIDHSKTATTKVEFMEYFKNCKKAYAWRIKGFRRITPPINPWQAIPKFWPPMSFNYVDYSIED